MVAASPSDRISSGVPVRKFVDETGQHVFTNDPYYHLNNRKKRD